MYKYILFSVVLFCQLFSEYDIGDIISADHLNMEFNYCYPSDSTGTFSFSNHTEKVFVLDMSASW